MTRHGTISGLECRKDSFGQRIAGAIGLDGTTGGPRSESSDDWSVDSMLLRKRLAGVRTDEPPLRGPTIQRQILQVLSVTLFEKTPILRAFQDADFKDPYHAISNQLILFDL